MPTSVPGPVELARCVRFCINPAAPPQDASAGRRHNTFAAWPGMIGLGAYYELHVRCRGEPDPVTGYLLNISVIDDAVRRLAVPIVHRATAENPAVDPARVLRSIMEALAREFGGTLEAVRWCLTPYHSITMEPSRAGRVVIAQQFEFAAAHRLHSASLSPEQNRAIFGRCNNPSSHGHNYRLEVAAETPLSEHGSRFTVAELERIVDERIIQRFDHKNLNLDVPEFEAVNPSVENIARTCHELIRLAVSEAGAELSHVTVWETEKTSCTYRG